MLEFVRPSWHRSCTLSVVKWQGMLGRDHISDDLVSLEDKTMFVFFFIAWRVSNWSNVNNKMYIITILIVYYDGTELNWTLILYQKLTVYNGQKYAEIWANQFRDIFFLLRCPLVVNPRGNNGVNIEYPLLLIYV